MNQDLNYYKILGLMPRTISGLFSGIPSWVEGKLFDEKDRGRILARTKEKGTQQQYLEKLRFHKDALSIIMLIFLIDRFFIRTYTMTVNTIELLNELGIDKFQIGNTVFEKNNENVLMGYTLHSKLFDEFSGDPIISEFLKFEYAYEIINKYQEDYSNVDLSI